MPFDLDSYLGVHAKALSLRAQRMTVLSENLANADTPNYKARDIDFRSTLAQAVKNAGGSLSAFGDSAGSHTAPLVVAPVLSRTNPAHLSAIGRSSGGAQTLYRIPHAPALDGNSVESDVELAAIGENALEYQATLTFLGGKFATLKSAITGE
jgi:flagellar basal-body rod protein FlgB